MPTKEDAEQWWNMRGDAEFDRWASHLSLLMKAYKDAIVAEGRANDLAPRKARLRQFEAKANAIWRNQQMSTHATASALLALIVAYVNEDMELQS